MSDASAASSAGSRQDAAQDPYQRPADTAGAIVLDYTAMLALPLYVAAAWYPRSVYAWFGGVMVLAVLGMAFGSVRSRRRAGPPSNPLLAALAFDTLAAALLLWLFADRIAVRAALHTLVIALLAVVGVLYAYSMIRMPRRAARAWSPLWER